MSEVTVGIEQTARDLTAVLTLTSWPAREQAQAPHAVHAQTKLARQFLADYADHPVVAQLNIALEAGDTLPFVITRVLQVPDWQAQLADLVTHSELHSQFWPEQLPIWQAALDDLNAIFPDNQLTEFISELLDDPLTKPVTIMPTLIQPLLNGLIIEEADHYLILLPPPKAWGESPPWPYRDGVEWALVESLRLLLRHVLAVKLSVAESEAVEKLIRAAVTLFLEQVLGEMEAMAYLVRAKRQYALPDLPAFVDTLRAHLADPDTPITILALLDTG